MERLEAEVDRLKAQLALQREPGRPAACVRRGGPRASSSPWQKVRDERMLHTAWTGRTVSSASSFIYPPHSTPLAPPPNHLPCTQLIEVPGLRGLSTTSKEVTFSLNFPYTIIGPASAVAAMGQSVQRVQVLPAGGQRLRTAAADLREQPRDLAWGRSGELTAARRKHAHAHPCFLSSPN